MKIKRRALSGAIIVLAIISTIYYFKENYVKKVPLYKQTDFHKVNSKESWRLFKEELKVSNENAKIEDFQLILDKNNRIYSVRFDLVDKDDDTFKVFHYSNCFSCELKEENQIHISKNTVSEWLQYDKMVDANRFFTALDLLNQKDFFNNRKSEYKLIVSSGWNEERLVEGNYYLLKDRNLQKVDYAIPQRVSSGFDLQVIGSDRAENFSTDKDTTKFVFIDSNIE
ncbi:hypothetical protein [Neobacillus sp. PS2-9]|uniref:hypothetical protein n=1 Tax=Neobacillus sp. PS2-9 TaxID=3070676 RepID=UPI0027DEF114|nr:hypothetical protein [Neobacillus sp. PS2-9]WML55985.1 hypothetical protein RCG25_13610 [Neobacillus sp. PS2-9]